MQILAYFKVRVLTFLLSYVVSYEVEMKGFLLLFGFILTPVQSNIRLPYKGYLSIRSMRTHSSANIFSTHFHANSMKNMCFDQMFMIH